MRNLIDSEGDYTPFGIVRETFTPTEKMRDCFEKHVCFIVASSINKLERQESISNKWRDSFAITQSYEYQGEPIHLIILNDQECNRLKLSDREKAAVILHELGHILNRHPELDSVLTLEQCLEQSVNYQQEQEKKKRISNEDEFYADQLPVSHGFKDEIVSCLDKSLGSSDYATLHAQFRQRILRLKQNDSAILNGNIKQFRYV